MVKDDRERLEIILNELENYPYVYHQEGIDLIMDNDEGPEDRKACLEENDRQKQMLEMIVTWVRAQPPEFWLNMLSKEEPR